MRHWSINICNTYFLKSVKVLEKSSTINKWESVSKCCSTHTKKQEIREQRPKHAPNCRHVNRNENEVNVVIESRDKHFWFGHTGTGERRHTETLRVWTQWFRRLDLCPGRLAQVLELECSHSFVLQQTTESKTCISNLKYCNRLFYNH